MTDNKPSASARILRTAHDLFYRDGIRATGVDRIIQQAGVTKVTFYRHFPAKNDLILAFLEWRHQRWIRWFHDSLLSQRQQNHSFPQALAATVGEWFRSEDFRGCAFINTAVELADSLPEVLPVIRAHKRQMAEVIATFIPDDPDPLRAGMRITLLIDGAIVMAQRDDEAEQAIALLQECMAGMCRVA